MTNRRQGGSALADGPEDILKKKLKMTPISDIFKSRPVFCGSSLMVKHLVANEKIAGSNPVFRSNE